MGRRLLLCAALAGAAACEPAIGPGAYYCGPDELCPPGLACDPGSFTCERPANVQPFACPGGSQDPEPDGDPDSAQALGTLSCGVNPLEGAVGCIAAGSDEDYLQLALGDTPCAGDDPHLDVRLRFPIGLVPLELALLDDSGAEVAAGEVCAGGPNFTGLESLCLAALPPPGTYYLRIRAGSGGDCGGACRFNQYLLDVRFLLA
jgi:hypothetical protein